MHQPRHTPEAFRALTNPSAVAVVGANDNLDAFTGGTLQNLRRHGYDRPIYPVNPKRDTVQDLPAYPSVDDVPGPIDSAVLVVRADLVIATLEACRRRGAQSAIVVASGFGEGAAGDRGRTQRVEFDRWLADHPMLILGPSTTGLVHVNDRYVPRAVTNQLPAELVRGGPIALISQSGASNNIIYNRAQAAGVGIGMAIATGVEANFSTWDAAEHALADDRIEVVAILAEQLGPPERWQRVCETAAELGKPIVVGKVGRTEPGSAAVSTHTGSLAGNWPAQRAALADAGCYLADDLDHMWELANLLAAYGHGPGRAARLGIIAFSGGEGALLADLSSDAGMELPAPSAEFTAIVEDEFTLAGAANPFDPTGEAMGKPDSARAAFGAFLADPAYDLRVIALNAQGGGRNSPMVDTLLTTAGDARSVISTWRVPGMSDGIDRALRDLSAPVFDGGHRAIGSIDAWSRRRPPRPVTTIEPRPLAADAEPTYADARAFLAAVGVPLPEHLVAATPEDAVAAADRLGYPVAMKTNGPAAAHKAQAGGVALAIEDREGVSIAAKRMLTDADEVVVEPMAEPGAELIVGATIEASAGVVVVVGAGGSRTEQVGDVALVPAQHATIDRIAEAFATTAVGAALPDAVARQVAEIGRALAGVALAGWNAEVNPLIFDGAELTAVDARLERAR